MYKYSFINPKTITSSKIRGAYDKFPDFFRMAFRIVVDSW